MNERKHYGVLHMMRSESDYLKTVESPYKGPDLLRKLMEIARNSGHFRRYFSLRRAWIKATSGNH